MGVSQRAANDKIKKRMFNPNLTAKRENLPDSVTRDEVSAQNVVLKPVISSLDVQNAMKLNKSPEIQLEMSSPYHATEPRNQGDHTFTVTASSGQIAQALGATRMVEEPCQPLRTVETENTGLFWIVVVVVIAGIGYGFYKLRLKKKR